MTAKSSFGQWLKQRRKTLDLTQEDLAVRIGCAVSTLYKIEAHERRPSKQIAELIAKHVNIPAAERALFVQFARTGSAESAAPWGTPFHASTNLPLQPTPLIGRDPEVSSLRKRLLQRESRLLTLIGAPGIGKTRLAQQVAADALDDFSDGVFFVALAAITDANLVSSVIANLLGILDVGPQTPLERLKAFLRGKQTLLVLDNFEQILAAAAIIADLLAACPWLKILATSRAPLRLRHEQQIPVSPLAMPDLTHLPDVDKLPDYSAVTLFLERAQTVQPDFLLTSENAPVVAAICTRLDGLPLAIELISARIKVLPPAALLERLHGRLMLQSDGLHDFEPRHRTLNAAIDWSYQLLAAEEQALFRHLGIFVGGWTLEAADAVCGKDLNLNLLDGMTSLLDKNLVKQDTRSDGEPRYMMLETIREYALEQLTASGELKALQRQHADYFIRLADTADKGMMGPQQKLWWDRVEADLANFRAVLGWSETGNIREEGKRMAVALGEFWARRGYLREGRSWIAAQLARQEQNTANRQLSAEERAHRAETLNWLAASNHMISASDMTESYYAESVALFRELGDKSGLAEVLADFGIFFQIRGDYELASTLIEESLSLRREIGHTRGIAASLDFLGTVTYRRGDIQPASALWEESLMRMRAENDPWRTAMVLAHVATGALEQGNYERAKTHLIESLTTLRELDERWQTAQTVEMCACLVAVQG
ncbi:MAG: helix-turn-helix domain-containing protein, partial [Anaerolineae bacterium]|nr:helix-turn-helix domain-containing protein [Anaerolineae bacterium]